MADREASSAAMQRDVSPARNEGLVEKQSPVLSSKGRFPPRDLHTKECESISQ